MTCTVSSAPSAAKVLAEIAGRAGAGFLAVGEHDNGPRFDPEFEYSAAFLHRLRQRRLAGGVQRFDDFHDGLGGVAAAETLSANDPASGVIRLVHPHARRAFRLRTGSTSFAL